MWFLLFGTAYAATIVSFSALMLLMPDAIAVIEGKIIVQKAAWVPSAGLAITI